MTLVADTSALVSWLPRRSPRRIALPPVLDGYGVAIPRQVLDELDDVASYEDDHADAARAITEERGQLAIHDVTLDPEFPLDDGENAAVQLTEDVGAGFLYCDEYTDLALVHATITEARLVTTPRLLHALVIDDVLSNGTAKSLLEAIGDVRSWEMNAYVDGPNGSSSRRVAGGGSARRERPDRPGGSECVYTVRRHSLA